MGEQPETVPQEVEEIYQRRRQTTNFPVLSITGGPIGRDVKMLLDGEPMRKVTGFKLSGMVNDVIRLKTYQIVQVAVSLGVDEVENEAKITVSQQTEEGLILLGEVKADTVWEALIDAGRQLELQAKQEPGVAQAGTIAESSGRPPGHDDKG